MDKIGSLIKQKFRGKVLPDEPMSLHTSLKVGGPADLFCIPEDLDDLRELLTVLAETGTPRMVVGGGFNLLVRDGGIRGAVISLERLNRLDRLDGFRMRAEAGVDNGVLVRFAHEERLAGLEFLIGIPGRLGGALGMNAGAHGEEILDRVESLDVLGEKGLETRPAAALDFGYRYLRLAPGGIIVAATFKLEQGDPAEMESRIEGFLAHRRNTQRVGYPNAGSFFRNPPGGHAWQLIDAAGLRGLKVGGAQVSQVHTNFLVNTGGATAADFLELARTIREKVKAQSGVELEEEVRIVGEE
ncbi:MAG: UDP-N-acetylmuramate dehydrogenase [Geobacter sp.]|nr:UDP-N-acetylmuramate dehydrogenase [Geobacter sp.]